MAVVQLKDLSSLYCGGKGRPQQLTAQQTTTAGVVVALTPSSSDPTKKILKFFQDDEPVLILYKDELLEELSLPTKTATKHRELLLQSPGLGDLPHGLAVSGPEARLRLRWHRLSPADFTKVSLRPLDPPLWCPAAQTASGCNSAPSICRIAPSAARLLL